MERQTTDESTLNWNQKLILIGGHVIGWLLFLSGPYFNPMSSENAPYEIKTLTIGVAICLFVVVYLNYFIFIPRFLIKRNYIGYLVCIAMSATLLFFVYAKLNTFEPPPKPLDRNGSMVEHFQGPPPHPPFGHGGGGSNLFGFHIPFPLPPALMIFFITSGMSLFQYWLLGEKRRERTDNEQLKTELNFLKNQISPHFFFNALNTIYSLTETDGKRAREVTHKLSKLMRYLVYETEKQKKLALGDELEFLEHYIELAKMRLPDNVKVDLSVNVENCQMQVPPLIFLTFIENSFKHGVTFQGDCNIHFRFIQNDGILRFESENPINRKTKPEGGVGMPNVKRRLELIYGDKFELEYGPKGNIYHVKLLIHEN